MPRPGEVDAGREDRRDPERVADDDGGVLGAGVELAHQLHELVNGPPGDGRGPFREGSALGRAVGRLVIRHRTRYADAGAGARGGAWSRGAGPAGPGAGWMCGMERTLCWQRDARAGARRSPHYAPARTKIALCVFVSGSRRCDTTGGGRLLPRRSCGKARTYGERLSSTSKLVSSRALAGAGRARGSASRRFPCTGLAAGPPAALATVPARAIASPAHDDAVCHRQSCRPSRPVQGGPCIFAPCRSARRR